MPLKVYRLNPRPGGGFHFGRQGHGIETSHESFSSDSLFAAIISVYAELFDDVEQFISLWQSGSPPFVTSSVFPYVGDILLLPMPRRRVNLSEQYRRTAGKALKKIQYVSPAIFRKLVANASMDDEWQDATEQYSAPTHTLQKGKIWLAKNEFASAKQYTKDSIWVTDAIPRVTIDRLSNTSNIFFSGRTVFSDGCGLWFLADIQSHESVLDQVIEDLGIRGLGGERNVGYGTFDMEVTSAPDLPTVSAQHPIALTLSRYNPTFDELQNGVLGAQAAYELVKVGGWMASNATAAQRRKWAHFIEAGSVIQNIGSAPLGRLVDVSPEYDNPAGAPPHPIYRSGFALMIGVEGETA